MLPSNLIRPDTQAEIAAFKELVATVQKVGLSVAAKGVSNARQEALAFIVKATNDRYGKSGESVLKQLISDVEKLGNSSVKSPSCEVARRLDKEVQALMDHKISRLFLKEVDPRYRASLKAIYGLYLACKAKNDEQYSKGKVVSFAGVPPDFVPEWCQTS